MKSTFLVNQIPADTKATPARAATNMFCDEIDKACAADVMVVGDGVDVEAELEDARGEVDPDKLLPMEDINPNFRPGPGTGSKPLSTSKQSNQKGKAKGIKPAPSGGIYSFFGNVVNHLNVPRNS